MQCTSGVPVASGQCNELNFCGPEYLAGSQMLPKVRGAGQALSA